MIASARTKKIFPLLLLNLLLLAVLGYVLYRLGFLDKIFPNLFNTSKVEEESTKEIVEDPYLLEREELKKQWLVLEEKERLNQLKNDELDKKEQILEEKLKEADNQIALAKESQKKQEDIMKQWEDRLKNVRDLASKIGNMPPKDGVILLEKMDPVLAVDVIRQMDIIALEQGRKSITDYLLSLMDKEKAGEIIRLISRYPTNPEDKKPNQ